MHTPRRGRPLTAIFLEPAWSADLQGTTPAGLVAATDARKRLTANGVPATELRRCDAEGRDGTRLDGCYKLYLPPPAGRFGMVFRAQVDRNSRVTVVFLAFGVRHQPAGSHAPTVYQRAHRRLHAD